MFRRMDRDQHRDTRGGGYLVVFAPAGRDGPLSAEYGGPLHGGEPSSCSTDRPVRHPVPYMFPKGKGKKYQVPDPLSEDDEEDEAPDKNALTLPQEPFDLPNDVARTHRYGKGKAILRLLDEKMFGMMANLPSRVSQPTPWSAMTRARGSRCHHLVPLFLIISLRLK